MKMKRKLKTIQKLMEEYPDWYFDKHGGFNFNGDDCILHDGLFHLGKEIYDHEIWFDNLIDNKIEEKMDNGFDSFFKSIDDNLVGRNSLITEDMVFSLLEPCEFAIYFIEDDQIVSFCIGASEAFSVDINDGMICLGEV